MAVFGNGLNLRKWTGTVTYLIDVKKKRIFYIKRKKEIFCFVMIFLFE